MAPTTLPIHIQAMLAPTFYPHSVEAPIQVIQTHASYLILTGEYVYKLKKPIDLGFLDYSTLAKRRHYCQLEVQLNRRTAPDLYLGVVAITQSGSGFSLQGQGEIVDYAVQMCQFPQTQLFSSMVKQGKLQLNHMHELGQTVASFHSRAITNERIQSFGAPDQIKQAIDDNYVQTQPFVGKLQSLPCYQDIQDFTDQFFLTQVNVLESRQYQGFIRDCHGDLHLGNICLWHDHPTLFDCIEFNDSFRYVDLMYDIAFTIMDLEAQHCPVLKAVFLNTYLEHTGDWAGLQVLPLYLCRQAYVRAKVHSLMSIDPVIDLEEHHHAQMLASHYYDLAWRYTQPRTGQLILMSGVSGSGKSTHARLLAQQAGLIHIRSDAVRKHLARIPLQATGESALYTPEMTENTYRRLCSLGLTLAQQGWPVILDAKFDQVKWRSDLIRQAELAHVPIQIIHCTAPISVLQERLQSRQNDVSDATVALLDQQLAAFEPFTAAESLVVKTIDTSEDFDYNLLQSPQAPFLFQELKANLTRAKAQINS